MLSIFFDLTSPRTPSPKPCFWKGGSFYPDWMKPSSTLGILPRLDDSLPRPDEFDPNWMKVYPDWVSAKTPKKGYFPEVLEMILKCPRVVYSYPGLIPEHFWEIPLFGGFGTRPVGINSHPVGVKFIGSGYFSSSRG